MWEEGSIPLVLLLKSLCVLTESTREARVWSRNLAVNRDGCAFSALFVGIVSLWSPRSHRFH